MKIFNSVFLLIIMPVCLLAQSNKTGDNIMKSDSVKNPHGLLFTGNAYINYEIPVVEEKPKLHGAIFPIIAWKLSGKLFFETEASIEIEESEVKLDIEYATLHYKLNKLITISAGKFLSPFGTFQERLHPGWINKFPEAPPGYSHEGIPVGPMSEVGLMARGGLPLGNSKINYAAYISNGPQLITESDDSSMIGMLEYGKLKDNNNNKAFGGRIGFLPFSNSSLELGISRQQGKIGSDKDSLFSRARTVMHGVDLSYVKGLTSLKGIVDFKGQYNRVMTDMTNSDTADQSIMGNSTSMYDISKAYYLQVTYRPAMMSSIVIQNLEFAARYSATEMSESGMNNDKVKQYAFGINYWFSWRSVIKLTYQVTKENENPDESLFIIQFAICHPQFNFLKANKEVNK